MAEKALKQLEHQLTCHICLDRYIRPRTLPCLHSFCHDCLVGLPVDGNHCITCPVCRQSIRQPHNGVAGYQCAFLINSFLELHQLLEKVSGSKQNTCENCDNEQATGYCKDCSMFYCQTCVDAHNKLRRFTGHQLLGVDEVAATASKLVPLKEQPTMECTSHGKPLEVYCDTCDKLICHLCTIKHYRDHECDAIIDAFPRHKQQIVDRLQQVKEKVSAITTAVQTLEAQQCGFLEQVQAVRKEVETTVQQLMQFLQESNQQLMKELDQVANAYTEQISARKKEADISIGHLKSCEEFAQEVQRIGSQQEILSMKGQIMERMETVCSQVNEANLQPPEETILRFVKSASVVEACRSLGSIVKCSRVKTAESKISFDLCIAVSNSPVSSELISCKLSPVADPSCVVKCVIQQVVPGSFQIFYSPPTSGLHQLKVQVRGAHILNIPLTIKAATIQPRKPGQRFTCLSDTRPAGLAITQEGQLVVMEQHNHCITIIDINDGKRIRQFGKLGSKQLQFQCPVGMALLPGGNIVVADRGNNRLQVLTPGGVFVASVGSGGSQPLQFNNPWDVAIDRKGKVFIADRYNHRVQVLNPDLTYLHCFGKNGTQPGEFNTPYGIALDGDGMVYVADYYNNRVQKLTPEGNVLTVIDSKGKDGGRLNRPIGLCVDNNDILYVVDSGSSTVCMYSTYGEFLGYVGNSDGSSFKAPLFIMADKFNKLYISCSNGVTTY